MNIFNLFKKKTVEPHYVSILSDEHRNCLMDELSFVQEKIIFLSKKKPSYLSEGFTHAVIQNEFESLLKRKMTLCLELDLINEKRKMKD